MLLDSDHPVCQELVDVGQSLPDAGAVLVRQPLDPGACEAGPERADPGDDFSDWTGDGEGHTSRGDGGGKVLGLEGWLVVRRQAPLLQLLRKGAGVRGRPDIGEAGAVYAPTEAGTSDRTVRGRRLVPATAFRTPSPNVKIAPKCGTDPAT